MAHPPLLRFRLLVGILFLLGSFSAVFAWKTLRDLQPLPESLDLGDSDIRKPRVLDREGRLLSITFVNRWNTSRTPLHEFPEIVRQAFIESEDRRFYSHGGVDWLARVHALVQNVRAMRAVRGASTITEQSVRMLHPRPRTVWSRWVEGIEASLLERRFSKAEILEFYLNQVPYASRRRGVVEAARFYFDRDLETLNAREVLALAVLVRAPSTLDLKRAPKTLDKPIARLARHMLEKGALDQHGYRTALSGTFELAAPNRVIEASHFVQHIFKATSPEILSAAGSLPSTLEGDVQRKVRGIVDSRLRDLKTSDVGNAAVLAVDNAGGEVVAWVSGDLSGSDSGGWVDSVTTPRQPGSTLKPFLYALALEMGWTPATLIDDAPLAQPVRSGLHSFHNYSRTYYGPLRLRDALGNSLNTPAVRTIQFTGAARFLEWLHLLGVRSLSQTAGFYGQGLALGDGEVSLFELVQAYSVLARRGEFMPLRLLSGAIPGETSRIMDEKTASLVTDILSDPRARNLEFGEGHLLRFPVQTAIKTGTSTDHRDCWAVGYTGRYTVGVWMGNLDRRPTRGITGAIGPALVLRSVFAELNRYADGGNTACGGGLKSARICAVTGLLAGPGCPAMNEVFSPGNVPSEVCSHHENEGKTPPAPPNRLMAGESSAAEPARGKSENIRLVQPVPGLQIAFDPRIPGESQAFAFKLPKGKGACRVQWIVDGEMLAETRGHKYLWPVSRGTHLVRAKLWLDGSEALETPEVSFTVK